MIEGDLWKLKRGNKIIVRGKVKGVIYTHKGDKKWNIITCMNGLQRVL